MLSDGDNADENNKRVLSMGMQTGVQVRAVWGQRSAVAAAAKGQTLTVVTQSNGNSLGSSPQFLF